MSGTALVLALALVVGWPFAAMARLAAGRGARVALALLLGLGAIPLTLFLLSAARIPWSRPSLLLGLAVVAVLGWAAALRTPGGSSGDLPPRSPAALPFLALAALLVVGHGVYATAGPRIDSDFLEIWGLKGRIFFEGRGVDWTFLAEDTTFPNHPDYPPLVPLLFSSAAILRGRWEDPELGLFSTAFGAALLLIAEGVLRRRHGGSWLTGAAVLALTPLALSPWGGNADGVLVAFSGAAILIIREGLEEGARRTVLTGGVLLGLAAFTKNEGIAMIATAAVALLIAARGERRRIIDLWPAIALAALWLVPSHLAGLESDLAAGDPLRRLGSRLRDPLPLLKILVAHSGWRPLFWLGLAAGGVATIGRALRTERFALWFVLLHSTVYVGAYAVSPHDLEWHVRWSWERLVSHLAFLLTAAILSAIITTLRGSKAAADAEGDAAAQPAL